MHDGIFLAAPADAAMIGVWAICINPINQQMNRWKADAPPADWAGVRDRWEMLHTIRAILSLVALGTLLMMYNRSRARSAFIGGTRSSVRREQGHSLTVLRRGSYAGNTDRVDEFVATRAAAHAITTTFEHGSYVTTNKLYAEVVIPGSQLMHPNVTNQQEATPNIRAGLLVEFTTNAAPTMFDAHAKTLQALMAKGVLSAVLPAAWGSRRARQCWAKFSLPRSWTF